MMFDQCALLNPNCEDIAKIIGKSSHDIDQCKLLQSERLEQYSQQQWPRAMALHESDREDLMNQATAYDERMELLIVGQNHEVFVGFRADRFSIFLGADPVFHFDSKWRLRRCFRDGNLYRTAGTTLSRLTRERVRGSSSLIRHDLTAEELQEFFESMDEQLAELAALLQSGRLCKTRQIPPEPDLIPRLRQALEEVLQCEDRLAPRIKP